MPKKKTPKRQPATTLSKQEEDFCQAYASNGNKGAEAVRAAWPGTKKWKPQSCAVKSSKLLAMPKIQERFKELAAIVAKEANAKFSITQEEIIYRLVQMARGNLRHYVDIGPDGQPTVSLKNVTEEQWYALNELSIEDIVNGPNKGKRTKVKMVDRQAALAKLGQNLGMFKVDVKLNGGNPIPVVLSQAEAGL